MPSSPRVFISYSRKDGELYARNLRQRLEEKKIPLWQDRVGMEGGRDWWLQIVEALDQVEFMVLVMTPGALQSPIIRKEWRYARQKGVCVYPVKGVDDSALNYDSLPRWMSSAHFYDLEHEWTKFVNDLNTRCVAIRTPFMVEDLPDNFIPREKELGLLINQLLDSDRDEPVAITAALRGAGGYGKTTLVRAICHNERVQNAFDDGILWITLGQNPGDLTEKVNNLIEILDAKRPGFTEIQPALHRLVELLSDRDILLVIDDVWNSAHLKPLLQGGPRCARLITTRNRNTLPANCAQIDLGAMNVQEARKLLGSDISLIDEEEIDKLSRRLGEWPLLLKIVNAVLYDRTANRGQSLSDAITFVNKALDRRGLVAFDSHNPEDRNQAVSSTLSLSMNLLSDQESARFAELTIFPEDVDIPLKVVERLWQHAGYDDFETEDLCERLYNLTLLLNFDLITRQIRLHDVIRDYLKAQLSNEAIATHLKLLNAYGIQNWADLQLDETYLWKHIAYHLFESGHIDTLKALLVNFSYIKNKISVCGLNTLLLDYDYFPNEDDLKIVQSALRLSSNQLAFDQNQLAGHLFGRLMHQKSKIIKDLLKQAAEEQQTIWLRPIYQSLTAPVGPLVRTIEGHSETVTAVAISPDGKRALSGSHDGTLKIWDLITGEVIQTLEEHSDEVSAVAISPDGKRALSGSEDGSLIIWDLITGEIIQIIHGSFANAVAISADGKRALYGSWDLNVLDLTTGEVIQTLEGHRYGIAAVAISPDGNRALSFFWDRTFKIWDLTTGEIIQTVEGDSQMVTAIAISPDGKRALSGSKDGILMEWDLAAGEAIHTMEGHGDEVTAIVISPDGKRALSGSTDKTLMLWDLTTSEVIQTLEGHSYGIAAIAISPDGKRALSGSNDGALMVWDLTAGEAIHTMEGHSDEITSVAVSADGKLALTGSWDRTLKLWDLTSGEVIQTLESHGGIITAVAISADSKCALYGSDDETIKLWDLTTGEVIQTLEGHSKAVAAVEISVDGKHALSGSWDRTLKLWDLTTGEVIQTLEGHSEEVSAVAISADGKRALSGSWDRTLKLWDLTSGEVIQTLEGHRGIITAVAISADGKRALSGSDDETIKLWDLTTGEVIQTLEEHSDEVSAVAISPDGKRALSGSFDKSLKVWDLTTGKEIAKFIGESEISSCAAAKGKKIIVAGEFSGHVHILSLEGI
jgi:WD40 repeat protein